ncbi:prepilin-type N-terminal cleavage/methylation domain-containing protein [Thiofaba sp. EF100]|uniref:prepilin-type N-terminal cleavage/methylation domain-containing protein n=1 Tax=Thiofaba sp. EF100 TaxID=3121274 RepID=UPI003221EE1B
MKVSGFTLIEMLIAVSLTAVIALLAYSGLNLGSMGWSRAARVTAESDEARVAWAFVRAHVSEARPLRGVDDDEGGIEFEGLPDRLRFVAPAPRQRAAPGGLYTYVLELRDGALWLDWGLYLPDREGPRLEPPRRLVDGVESLRGFAYFGVRREGEGAAWHARWDRSDALPELVRIELSVAGVDWPEWVIPLQGGRGP